MPVKLVGINPTKTWGFRHLCRRPRCRRKGGRSPSGPTFACGRIIDVHSELV